MQDGSLLVIVPALFVVAFLALWCGIVWLVSRVGGWNKLASIYPEQRRIEGKVFRWRSGRIRPFSSYRNCLHVTLSKEGIGLETIVFMRVGHSPIFIPWRDIGNVSAGNVLFFSSIQLSVQGRNKARPTTITLYGRDLGENIRRLYAANG